MDLTRLNLDGTFPHHAGDPVMFEERREGQLEEAKEKVARLKRKVATS